MTRKKKTSLFLKLATVLLLFIAVFFFSTQIKNIFFYISSPLQKFSFQIGGSFYGTTEIIFNLREIKEEIRNLRLENSALSARVVLQRDILAENEALRKALDLEIRDEEEFIFSEVISVPSSGYLIIKHGEKMGVEEKFSVITPDGALLGSVVEVYPDFSKVMLLTSKDSSFEAKTEDYIGVLRGGEEVVLEMLPKDSNVKEGDLVTTFSQSEAHPRGLFIGSITEVIRNDVEAFIEAKVKPGFYLHEVDFLLILKR